MNTLIDFTQLCAGTARLWTLVLAILGQISNAIEGDARLDREVYRAATLWLRDAEALARRALFWLAVRLKYKAPRRGTTPAMQVCSGAHHPRERRNLFRLGLYGAGPQSDSHFGAAIPPSPYAVETPAPPTHYDATRLHLRIAALRAACADPMRHARRLARRMARRFHMTPDVLRQLARKRPCRALRQPLLAIFREPPEIRPRDDMRLHTGPDPPSDQSIDNIVPLFNAQFARRGVMSDRMSWHEEAERQAG